MAGEDETIVEEVVDDAAAAAQAAADFASGFAETSPKKPAGTPSPETKGAEPATTGAPVAKAEPEPAATPAPKYVRITEADLNLFKQNAIDFSSLKQSVEKQLGTAFGKMGGFERTLREMQSANPAGATVKLPKSIVAKIEKEFSPELAEIMFEALEGAAQHMRGTGHEPSTDKPAVAAIADPASAQDVESKVEARVIAMQKEALEDRYPDWRRVIGAVDISKGQEPDPNHPFRKWVGTLPEADQRKINSTNSADVVARFIERFHAAAKPKPKPNLAVVSDRTDRLREAVQPKGDGGPPARSKTDFDQFSEGFRTG